MLDLDYYTISTIYLIFQFLPVLAGLCRYKQLDSSFRIVFVLCLFSFLGESAGLYSVIRYRNNLLVYNIVELFTTTTICFYFNSAIGFFKKYNIGILFAALSLLMWIGTNTIFIRLLNIPFLTYTGIMVITMSIIAIDNLIGEQKNELFHLKYSPHFWFASITTFYWCFSLVQWISYHFLVSNPQAQEVLTTSLTLMIIIMNTVYSYLIFSFPKMIQKNVT